MAECEHVQYCSCLQKIEVKFRVATLFEVLGDVLPMGHMERASKLAPGLHGGSGYHYSAPFWAEGLAEDLLTVDIEKTAEKISYMKTRQNAAPYRGSSRSSGVDPVTAFIAGAVLF